MIVNGDAVASISDGKSFGELALLYNTPRQATIRSQGPSQLFSLDRVTFRYILAKSSADRSNHIQQALSKVTLLSGLTPQQLHKISQAVDILKFEPGLFKPSISAHTCRAINYSKGIRRKHFLHDQGRNSPRHRRWWGI